LIIEVELNIVQKKNLNFIMTSENNKKPYVPEFKQLMRSSRLIKSRPSYKSSNIKKETPNDEHTVESEGKTNLKLCLDCGREVSESAPSCPSCGRPNPTIEINKTGKLKFTRKAEQQALLVGGS